MTPQETKAYIAGRLTAPLTEVSRLIESFNATIDLVTALNTDVIPTWTALLTFQTDGTDAGKYCKHPDSEGKVRIWETKVDDNIGNEPPVDPGTSEDANWKEISPSAAAAIPEWTPGLYGEGLVIVYHNHSTDGRALYVLLEPTRPFTSENIETEIPEGKWASLGGGIASSLQRVVATSAHGFVLKNVLTLDNTGALVKVSNPSSDKFVGIVTEVINANLFRIHTGGYVTGLSGLTAGAIHYAQTDGTLGTTQTDMPVLFADSTTSGYILASGASGGAGLRFGTAAGTDTYTLTLTPPLTEYATGLALLVKFTNTNTDAATLNVNSLGAKDIVVRAGIPVIAGQLTGDKFYLLVYDGTRFQATDLPWISNSTNAKAAYIDANGRIRYAEGSLFDVTNRAWQFTGLNNTHSAMVRWQNSDEELLLQLWNDSVAEFGTSGAAGIEIPTSIASENAYLLINDDQDVGFRILDRNGDAFSDIKTTNGDKRSIFRQPIGKAFTFDFETIIRQVHAFASDDDPGAQNILATVEVPSGYYIHVRLKTAIAWSDLGNRMISSRPIVAIGFNTGTLEGTAENPAPIYHGGPANGGFNINFNGSTGEVEIRLENENDGGSGYNYVCDVEFEYTVIPIPA